MFKIIEGLPADLIGVTAEGTVTKADYDKILTPLLDGHYRRGERVRFLYQIGDGFAGFTAGAAWDDFKVGLKYLRLFERCAIVTNVEWIRNATSLFDSFLPCPMRVFRNDEFEKAVSWLASPESDSTLDLKLTDDGIVIVKPKGPLRNQDFDKIAHAVDPWIESHEKLRGVVIGVEKFPGWENIGSFIHHFEFVREHQRKVRRVALAVDGALPEMMSKFASHFVEAQIKQFPFEKMDSAIAWVRE
jgi:hypothetical protein